MACLFLLDSLLQLALTSTHPAHLFDSLVPGVTWTTSKKPSKILFGGKRLFSFKLFQSILGRASNKS